VAYYNDHPVLLKSQLVLSVQHCDMITRNMLGEIKT